MINGELSEGKGFTTRDIIKMVIFKRKTMHKENFLFGIIVHVHQKDWIDTDDMLICLQKAWEQRPCGGLLNTKSLLEIFWLESHF